MHGCRGGVCLGCIAPGLHHGTAHMLLLSCIHSFLMSTAVMKSYRTKLQPARYMPVLNFETASGCNAVLKKLTSWRLQIVAFIKVNRRL